MLRMLSDKYKSGSKNNEESDEKKSQIAKLNGIKKYISKENNKPKNIVKKPRLVWTDSFTLLKINPPELIKSNKMKKKYSVKVVFLDEKRVRRSKTIFFGDKDRDDYIDHKDEIKKTSRINRLRHVDDIFHKDFWNLNLLNNAPTIGESYTMLLKDLELL